MYVCMTCSCSSSSQGDRMFATPGRGFCLCFAPPQCHFTHVRVCDMNSPLLTCTSIHTHQSYYMTFWATGTANSSRNQSTTIFSKAAMKKMQKVFFFLPIFWSLVLHNAVAIRHQLCSTFACNCGYIHFAAKNCILIRRPT